MHKGPLCLLDVNGQANVTSYFNTEEARESRYTKKNACIQQQIICHAAWK